MPQRLKFTIYLLLLVGLGSLFNPVLAQKKDAILGVWYTKEKDGKVRIYKCNGHYCGKLIWGKKAAEGEPQYDENNPDPEKRDRKLVGIKLLKDFKYDEDENQWVDGTIYNPRNGKTYNCFLDLMEDGRLKVKGYVGFSWIGKTTYWTKVE